MEQDIKKDWKMICEEGATGGSKARPHAQGTTPWGNTGVSEVYPKSNLKNDSHNLSKHQTALFHIIITLKLVWIILSILIYPNQQSLETTTVTENYNELEAERRDWRSVSIYFLCPHLPDHLPQISGLRIEQRCYQGSG